MRLVSVAARPLSLVEALVNTIAHLCKAVHLNSRAQSRRAVVG